jgi:hypothetical protein
MQLPPSSSSVAPSRGRAKKRISVRRIKRLRLYRIEEAATAVGAHKRTVQGWVRDGLPINDSRRPHLVRGADLIEFFGLRQRKRQQRCLPGQLFCLKCRRPTSAAEGFAYFHPGKDGAAGNLSALCDTCGSITNRRANNNRLAEIKGDLTVTVVEPATHKRVDLTPLNL